jgi:Cu(I)/Ag(I) efflux system membrane fusion protein
MINAAKDRLLLLGMSANQVSQVVKTRKLMFSVPVFSNYSGFVTELNKTNTAAIPSDNMQAAPAANQELTVKEGMYVQKGQAIFSLYNQSKAWILLDIFPEQHALVQVGNAVRIVPETAPQNSFRAQISYIEPVFRPGTKTVSARVYFNNAALQLPIGSRVTANIFVKPQTAWWLPREAVLTLGRDKIVFKKDEGGFRAHKITTGPEVNRYIHVLTGLQKQDSVALNAQFLIDNETFIKVNEQ